MNNAKIFLVTPRLSYGLNALNRAQNGLRTGLKQARTAVVTDLAQLSQLRPSWTESRLNQN